MIAFEMLRWWYGRGWLLMFQQAGHRLSTLGNAFSVSILLRTLFAPWRRIISYPGAGIDAHLRAILDNFISRCIGFVVRFLVLLTVGLLAILALLIGIVQVVIWPLVPLVVIASLVKGLA